MTTENRALEQANTQMSSIIDMVAALNCDYNRLYDLREYYDGELDYDELEELAELEEIAEDCESEDDARERIKEDALEVQVRADWHSPGAESSAPNQFYILLCTGGPAVRIMGELNGYGEPDRAWLEYQDWGTPWTERVNDSGDMEALLAYAQCFYFGE